VTKTTPRTEIDVPMLLRVVYGEVARLRLPPRVDHQDAHQDAALGCLQALSRYDPARGLKPQTLMSSRARGAALDYLRTLDPCGRTLRKRVKMGLAEPINLVQFDGMDDKPMPDPSAKMPDDLAATAELVNRVARAIRTLGDRDWQVISLMFWCEIPANEVACRLRICERRVWQLRKRALGKLREYLGDRG